MGALSWAISSGIAGTLLALLYAFIERASRYQAEKRATKAEIQRDLAVERGEDLADALTETKSRLEVIVNDKNQQLERAREELSRVDTPGFVLERFNGLFPPAAAAAASPPHPGGPSAAPSGAAGHPGAGKG